jgi:alkylated DNA repair protein alkB homolog 1
MSDINQLDAHQRPPDQMRSLFKKHQKSRAEDLDLDAEIIDMSRSIDELHAQLKSAPDLCIGNRDDAFRDFLVDSWKKGSGEGATPFRAYEVQSLPGSLFCLESSYPLLIHVGLYVLPGLLYPKIQLALLDRLLHRDLSDPKHRTNVHLHHHVSYPVFSSPVTPPRSFFNQEKSIQFPPKQPAVHKPITTAEFLEKKLRWMTLGGQYDWTAKRYPAEIPPPFPADIKQLLKALFPDMEAQAAIINFYTPGDTLSIHRDVSEYCDKGLVSISIGCDGLFIVGNQDGSETATIRLRSGDALYMTGSSRYAWHGVPKILSDTCPDWLAQWPTGDISRKACSDWQGWMQNKRINLNVRQMADVETFNHC